MSIFAAAENVLANAAPTLFGTAATGTFSPSLGAPSTVRVIPWEQEESAVVFETDVRNPGRGFKVPRADLATRPLKGDRLVYASKTYTCTKDALGDIEATEWTLFVDGGV